MERREDSAERVARHAKHQQMLVGHAMQKDGRDERRKMRPGKAKRSTEKLGFKPSWEGQTAQYRHNHHPSMLV